MKQKRSVYMVSPKNDRGFTMIQSLLAVSFLALCLPLLSTILKSSDVSFYEQDLSVQQFFTFVQDDVKQAISYELKDTGRIIQLNLLSGISSTLELYGSLIRRRVNGTGHEIYLRDVEAIHFRPLDYGFSISVTMVDGENYEKTIVFYNK
ncbi:competence type IV pilus minor pilin ComGF [Oceanobacillus kapialis]|uniref:Competence type IV pilus minor pilin ComGF n=1 Tax=Oceanobacillus kapialis TaxID=481353 RepID=A0ABW5Q579_9BACI